MKLHRLIFHLTKLSFLFSLLLLTVITLPRTANADTTLYSDTFTNTDGTTLNDHNNNWTDTNVAVSFNTPGHATISNNAVVSGINEFNELNMPNTMTAYNQCVSNDILFPMSANATHEIQARKTASGASGTFYNTYINESDHTSGLMIVLNGSVASNQVVTLDPWPSNGWHNYKICAIGSTITEYIDNVQVQSFTDTSITTPGWAAIRIKESQASVDNFVFSSSDTATPTPTPTHSPTPTPTPVLNFDISGNVYVDSNSNGVKDGSESSYQGATITLSGPYITTQSTTTDSSGNYAFSQKPSGAYRLTLTMPSGYVGTTIGVVDFGLVDDTTVNFGIAPEFSGTTIFHDEFTDANGTSLQAHDNTWTSLNLNTNPPSAGTAIIQNNTLKPGTNESNEFDLPSTMTAFDQCVSQDILFPMSAGASHELFARVNNGTLNSNSNFYFTYINENDHTSGLATVINGSVSNQVVTLDPWPSNGWHNYKICAIGSTITEYIDNQFIQTRTDTSITTPGTAAVRAHESQASIDNFVFKGTSVNSAPQVNAISINPNPVQIDTSLTATTTFTDANSGDTHTATADWGDGSSPTSCSVTQASDSVSCTRSGGYSTANVYPVTIIVSDGTVSVPSPIAFLSVYNSTPQGVFTAGNIYTSPAGAYAADTNLTGTVRFGLSYKYQGSVPTGNRNFVLDFNAADFHFNANSVTSLVISNGVGTLTGTGTITGSSQTYNFLVVGKESNDTIRIQITDPANFAVIYDTQPGAAANATPTTTVSGNVLAN